ncbi:MAG: alanine--tRNA ligase, partial [Bacteroidales bacterium]|nr:alanine--tRNA ligase [Bacteroidales bacterium]
FQIVLETTPFYAESGGQVGDTGILKSNTETIIIRNAIKENNLILHVADKMPQNVSAHFTALVDEKLRQQTQNNHSATHLLQLALRTVVGSHVEQKGSLVTPERLRFDFSHFSKVTEEQLLAVEKLVNEMVRANVPLERLENMPIEEAKSMGAMALFGEKYGDKVRVIRFGNSIELCGGTHTSATGNIGLVKIISEGAIAAGIRRIEAVTGAAAEDYLYRYIHLANHMQQLLNSSDIIVAAEKLLNENSQLKKEIENYLQEKVVDFVNKMRDRITTINDIQLITLVDNYSPDMLREAAQQLRSKKNVAVVFGSTYREKANITVAFSDDLVERYCNAVQMVKEIGSLIQGGGGGQAGYASAGGKNYQNVKQAVDTIIAKIAALEATNNE